MDGWQEEFVLIMVWVPQQEYVGVQGEIIVSGCHAPQLLFAFDSVMEIFPDVSMLAQARTL